MLLEQVVDEGHDGNDGGGWCEKAEACEAFYEAGDRGCGQVVGGREEGIEVAEDTRAVFAV